MAVVQTPTTSVVMMVLITISNDDDADTDRELRKGHPDALSDIRVFIDQLQQHGAPRAQMRIQLASSAGAVSKSMEASEPSTDRLRTDSRRRSTLGRV